MIKPQYIVFFLFQIALLTLPTPSGAQRKAYHIGPRDVLTITIYAGGEKRHGQALTVSDQGTIQAPFIGTMEVEGLTLSELEKRITEPLAKDYFVNPKVNIQITEYHSLQYYIYGAVRSPGLYSMTSEASLLVLIAKAGGVLSESGNLAYIMEGSADAAAMAGANVETLASRTESQKVDLQRLIEQGDLSVNPMLKPGDVVYIPRKDSIDQAESKVYLDGEVKRPGIYDYHPGLTALNACIMAGGFAKFAAPNRTKIIRKNGDQVEVIKINLNHVKAGKIPDFELEPGDRIHVPETWL